MKKLIVTVIILFIGVNSYSQEFDLGVKAGINFSNVYGLDKLNLEYTEGIVVGVFAGVKFSDRIGLQVDALYSEQGAKFTSSGSGKFDLTYLNVPVVLKYYLVDDQPLYIQVGPQVGFLINDDLRTVIDNSSVNAAGNDTDIAAVMGMGYDFPYGIRLEGRFNLGITSITDYQLESGRHKYISLTIGYSFL
ncbi:porin family protein [Aequorivita xiaoshiensis]|uniref:PorT family protein n=1 Tax=Aequorivita xiaoshiensis TaxID=2874476 RepID=A0A9X1R4H1_9FLAO|nr:porin family protein [Aequorivita xiaoshiensis]MCG2431393.1 PorT family protein [Aequorivita xiaoshiensis]